MTTKQELREQINLINENRRLLINSLQESEKARSMHAMLNRGVASELGLECGADWSKLPELVKKLKTERDSFEETLCITSQELGREENRADSLGEICGDITKALGSFSTDWSDLPRKVEVLKARSMHYEEELVKYSWRKATLMLPPVEDSYPWCSIDVLLSVPDGLLPFVAYYDFNAECWIDFHTNKTLYVNWDSEWTFLPQK